MSVPSSILKNKWQGNNVQTNFTYGFKIFDKDELFIQKLVGVVLTTLTVDVDYTVNGIGNDDGGSIDYPITGSPLATGEYLIIKPSFEYTQELILQNQQAFPPKSVENALDVLCMQIKQIAEELSRAIQLGEEYDGDASALLAEIIAAADYAQDAHDAAMTATDKADIATAQALLAQSYAAGLNIPGATLGDALKSLRVKSDGTGYELYTATAGASGALKDMDIGEGLENDGASALRVKLDAATLARGAGGMKVADGGVTDTQLNTTGAAAGTYTNATVTVTDKGRLTAASSGTPGLTSVSQGNVNTTTGTISGSPLIGAYSSSSNGTATFSAGSAIILPGGQYGFTPASRLCVKNGLRNNQQFSFWGFHNTTSSYVNALAPIGLGSSSGSSQTVPTGTIYAEQRYITSSPPYDLGDGEVAGFLFALVNPAGEIVSHYFAMDPPWAYNGPTETGADYYDPETKKKYRLKRGQKVKNLTALDVLSRGRRAFAADERDFNQKLNESLYLGKVKALRNVSALGLYEAEQNFVRTESQKIKAKLLADQYEFLTHDIKNADMGLIPHPFLNVPEGHTVVMIDPQDARLADLLVMQKGDGVQDVVDTILSGLKVTADFIEGRKGPAGVRQVKLQVR